MDNNKKPLIGFLGLVIVAIMVGGGVYAYFNDLESNEGNEAQSGTLDLMVNGENPLAIPSFDIGSDGLVYPGFSGVKTLTLKNIGSINGVVSMDIANIVGAPGNTTEPEALLGTDEGELEENIVFVITFGAVEVYNGTLADWSSAVELGDLVAGATVIVTISYSVATTVGNIIHDDSVTFDLEFELAQDVGNE